MTKVLGWIVLFVYFTIVLPIATALMPIAVAWICVRYRVSDPEDLWDCYCEIMIKIFCNR